MDVFFYCALLIFIALLLHFFLWKIYLPKNHTKALLCVFFGVLIAGVILFGVSAPRSIYEYIQLVFLFVSLALVYIVTYSAIEVDSPSLMLVLDIAHAGPAGLSLGAFQEKMSDGALVIDRVFDLVKGGFVDFNGRVYKITRKGRFIARIFIVYRKLLKASKGG